MFSIAAAATRLPASVPPAVRAYAKETCRPLASLAFAMPLILIYEIGVLAFPQAARNGADVWMRGWLDAIGLNGYCLLPVLTIASLLAWHHTTREPWRLPRGVLTGMTVESILLGLLLLVFAQAAVGWTGIVGSIEQVALNGDALSASRPSGITPGDSARLWIAWPAVERLMSRGVEFVGAGLYEEVLFRLLLLPLTLAVLASCMTNRTTRTTVAIVSTSLLFAAAHHVGAHGEPLVAGVFLFRAVAGVFFAVLFLRRGFGIAIGAHAAYDLIAGLCYR